MIFIPESKNRLGLILLHLLNVMLLLIRADKLGKENDNLALLAKEKIGRICSSAGVFLEAGQGWTFMDDCMIVKKCLLFPLFCMSY